MKIAKKLIAFAAITAMALFTVSCGEEDHDHDHDHGDHDHSNHETAKDGDSTASIDPSKTCVVSGEKLGGMGDIVTLVHEGTTVKLCCDDCVPQFKKDPAKYIAKLK